MYRRHTDNREHMTDATMPTVVDYQYTETSEKIVDALTQSPTNLARKVLEQCVGDIPDFAAGIWGRHRHVRRNDGDWSEIISLADIDSILTSSLALRPANVRLLRDGRTVPPPEYIRTSRARNPGTADANAVLAMFTDGNADPDSVLRKLDASASLVLQAVQRYHEPLGRFCRHLELALGHRCHANVYLTPPNAQALQPHSDPHHVFVFQIHGTKDWALEPTPHGRKHGGENAPQNVRLEPGDVLYFPSGTRHSARSQDSWSIHLTIGVSTQTWRSLVRSVVEDVLSQEIEEIDESLPVGWLYDTPRAELEDRTRRSLDLIGEALAGADPALIVAEAAEPFLTERRRLMSGALQDRVAMSELGESSPLRRRDGIPLEILPAADTDADADADIAEIRLAMGDRTVTVDARLSAATEMIAAVGEFCFTPRDLADLIPYPTERLELCRLLIREGALTLVR